MGSARVYGSATPSSDADFFKVAVSETTEVGESALDGAIFSVTGVAVFALVMCPGALDTPVFGALTAALTAVLRGLTAAITAAAAADPLPRAPRGA